METKLPHKFNNKMEQHPDYAIRILEELGSNSFLEHTQELQKMFNVDIVYFFNYNNKKMEFVTREMMASYAVLPAFLVTHVQKIYQQVFPQSDYPIGLYLSPKERTTYLGAIPTIKNSNNFGALLNIFDYAVEDYIKRGFVKALLPFANVEVDFNIKNNAILQECLFKSIDEHKVKKVEVDMINIIKEYENLSILAKNGQKADYNDDELLKDKFEMIQGNFTNFTEHLANVYADRYGMPRTISVRLANEEELNVFKKPEVPATIRYKQYEHDQKIKSRTAINEGSVGKQEVNYGI